MMDLRVRQSKAGQVGGGVVSGQFQVHCPPSSGSTTVMPNGSEILAELGEYLCNAIVLLLLLLLLGTNAQ